MNREILFESTQLGPYTLKNRIVLPPLTRSRSSQPGNIPNDLMADYYRQRAGAGFMVTEGTQIEPRGQGYAWTPGMHSPEQVEGWRKITAAVHAEGSIIFAQLWHVGRVSHNSLQPGGAAPVAPSAIAADNVKVFVETGPGQGALTEPSVPRALTTAEVKELVQLYAQAARNALDAGFDGVELHCANGYLVNQFISSHTNRRTDEYGGPLQNRLRFLREVVQAVADVVGKERLGVRFAPLFASTEEDRVYLGLVEEDPHETYIEAIKVLEQVGIAYVSLAEADWDNAPELPETFRNDVRSNFSGKILYAGKYNVERGVRVVKAGWGDLIAFGRPFIANPDLPERIAQGWPLNAVDPATMYGGTDKGYTDYPSYRP
ncbi:alkene reductase [Pseudomonas putida]|uniref:alkene reductase n=1 Tax=Pseudomonadota TaxID=1224 RepID=UPI0018D9487E|nr:MULTISPECIES: alkene reductase [Pseudomonas]MBH3373890.1 alkene reductase [Pseudomonas juntendi]MBS6037694.1 alkene reductase [Pseudomonas sp.]CAH0649854.1 N-ethylmaleimide reductase [Pseudomonas sp. Nvir]